MIRKPCDARAVLACAMRMPGGLFLTRRTLMCLVSLSPRVFQTGHTQPHVKQSRITQSGSLLDSSSVHCTPYRSLCTDSMSAATNCAQSHEKDGSKDIGDAKWKEKLTAHEFDILRGGQTDPRHGPLDNFFGSGTYTCAACGTLLYTSEMKFACGCGWPGFWDCVPKAVREVLDADGRRQEIVCNACNSHLGHVFREEGFTNPPPNERHCVNDTAIKFHSKE